MGSSSNARGLRAFFLKLQHSAGRPWYPLVIGSIAAVNFFVVILPVDPLFIGSTLLARGKWRQIAWGTIVGSTLGALALAFLVQTHGIAVLERFSPGITQTQAWLTAQDWASRYGAGAAFLAAALPTLPTLFVAAVALVQVPIQWIFIAVLSGRLLKYTLLGWVLSRRLPSRSSKSREAELQKTGS